MKTGILQRMNADGLFHDLKVMGRNNFTYNGAMALMEYLEELSEDMGKPIEYDPIAFCCDYAEYSSLEELVKQYDAAPQENQFDNRAEWVEKAIGFFTDRTTFIPFEDGIIIGQF